MQVFKAAIRVVLKHPVYILVYVGFLSAMGIFIASSINNSDDTSEFSSFETPIGVIDRDNSELSEALTSFLEEQGVLVTIEDTTFALQDAVATGEVGYLLVIPENYEDAFITSAQQDTPEPVLETTFSYSSTAGSLVDQQVGQYMGLVRAAAILEPTASMADILTQANSAAEKTVVVETIKTPKASSPADTFSFYLQWGTYTMTAAIVVCVGVVMSAFNRTDVRRRNAVSPLTTLGLSVQKAAACLLVTLVVWGCSCGLGLIAFGSLMAQVPVENTLLMLFAAFVFSLVPLSIGFLLGQLGVGEQAANAVGNISGMVMSFLGGAWVSIDMLPTGVQTFAHFLPTYWYTDTIKTASHLSEVTLESITPFLSNLGIIALFALALFAISLMAGRVRMRSSEAGGNAAASTTAA